MNCHNLAPRALRNTTFAIALAAASVGARADLAINATIDFDNLASGSTANAALGSFASLMHFANPDTVLDVDAGGSYTGTFHWVDATGTYGDVLVASSANAVSSANVLANDHQPILLAFNAPVDIATFSIQQDRSGFGNPQTNGTHLAFLDGTGHELAGSNVFYTQFGQPGLAIQNGGVVSNVSAVLLAGGTDYDNLRLVTVAAIPEPYAIALLLAGAGLVITFRRRQRNTA